MRVDGDGQNGDVARRALLVAEEVRRRRGSLRPARGDSSPPRASSTSTRAARLPEDDVHGWLVANLSRQERPATRRCRRREWPELAAPGRRTRRFSPRAAACTRLRVVVAARAHTGAHRARLRRGRRRRARARHESDHSENFRGTPPQAGERQHRAREKRLGARRRQKRPQDGGNGPADKEDKEEDLPSARRRRAPREAKELSFHRAPVLRPHVAPCSHHRTRLRRRPKRSERAVGSREASHRPRWRTASAAASWRQHSSTADGVKIDGAEAPFSSRGRVRAALTRRGERELVRPEARRMWLLRTRAARTGWRRRRARGPARRGKRHLNRRRAAARSRWRRRFKGRSTSCWAAHRRPPRGSAKPRSWRCWRGAARTRRRAPLRRVREHHPRDSGYRKSGRGRARASASARSARIGWSEWSGGRHRSLSALARSTLEVGPPTKRQRARKALSQYATRSPRRGRRASASSRRALDGAAAAAAAAACRSDSESSPGASEKAPRRRAGSSAAPPAVSARGGNPRAEASRLGLARDRSEASMIGGGEKGESREGRERLGLGGFLDAVSAAAMKDATRHLCPSAMDALLGDGVGVDHPGCEGPSRRDSVTGGEDEHHEHHEHSDASSKAKIARAVIMGRLSGAVAFTRQLNGVQRRDHNKRFRAVAQRRKNTLESILVSTNGASRLCETMALMLERLLLGRATQAAPAQPSLPGWILLVEDAHWLDPFSMGLIRALLDRCSIPLAIVMTHVSGRDGLETADADRTDSGLNAKTRNDARAYTRADESMHSVTSPRTAARRRPARNRATRLFRKSFQKMFRRVAPTCGAPASVCPRRASRRWTTSDGYAKTWTGCWRCTPPRWWTSRRSADRTCASSWRCASRARCAASLARPPAPAKPWPAPPRPRRWTRAGATARRARAIRRTKGFFRSRRIRRTKRRARRAARAAARASVGLPSAVHAELYKNTGGDPLHAATLANLLVSCGAVSVIQKGVGGVPEVVFKAEPETLNPGAAATNIFNSGLSSAAVARMHARDAAMETSSAGSPRTPSPRSRPSPRPGGASAPRRRTRSWRAAWRRGARSGSEKRDSMASVFRRCSS